MTSHGCFAVIAAVTFGQNHTDGHISLALQLAIPDWNSLVDSLFQTLLPPEGFTIVYRFPCGAHGNAQRIIRAAGVFPAVANVATLSTQKAVEVAVASDIAGSVLDDTVVQKNCSLHIRGNLLGGLTIEPGAKVVVEGSVDGRIVNRGGRLVVNNKAHASCITTDGPAETEACGTLRIDLTAIVSNWEKLVNHARAECAAVVKGNAYGCGIEPIAGALAKTGCKVFFVSDIPEARRVRAVAPNAAIYVLRGLHAGPAQAFADINAQPVIYSSVEMAEWDHFVASHRWTGGCALHVDTGESRLGFPAEEAAAFGPGSHGHGITLLMSRLDNPEKPANPLHDRQISLFRELRRLYHGIPASLANSSGIFAAPKGHFDLVRAGAALYGVNPTQGEDNPMLPAVELHARIVQVLSLAPGETFADAAGWAAKRPTRLALVSVGYADGYPRSAGAFENKFKAIVGGRRCPVVGHSSMDLLAIDVTEVSDRTAARHGGMATLIGPEISIEDLAAAGKATCRELLSHLGHRFHRIYHVT
jgi:alanine racemase